MVLYVEYGCHACDRVFASEHAAQQHMDALNHHAPDFKCDSCPLRCNTWEACVHHMNNTGHWIWTFECETCEARFNTQQAVEEHMEEENHYSYQYDCETCDYLFPTAYDRDRHQQQEGHYKHLYCKDCNRYFQNANNLSQHKKSRIHQGFDTICPFCNNGFVTATGVTHHLESGSCPNAQGLNREALYRELRRRDPNNVITERLLEDPTSRSLDQSWQPESAWNGHTGYECYICHGVFSTPNGLHQHITSPIHATRLYHCPNSPDKCFKKFPSLAALFNHLESESCGYMRFEAVKRCARGFLVGKGLISI